MVREKATARKSTRSRMHRARPVPKFLGYSHIQTLPRPERAISPEPEGLFVTNPSQEHEIRDQSEYEAKLGLSLYEAKLGTTSAQDADEQPFSYAMATKTGRHSSTHTDGAKSTLEGPMSLESLGSFRYGVIKKKPKRAAKWSPLDLSVADSASERGTAFSDEGGSRLASPKQRQSPILQKPTPQPFPELHLNVGTYSGAISKTTPVPLRVREPEGIFDDDPTPRVPQNGFESRSLFPEEGNLEHPSAYDPHSDPFDSDVSDTESVKERTEEAMARLYNSTNAPLYAGATDMDSNDEDAFDSLEWDPDLPNVAARNNSPEPVIVKPQAVAYTTVGSVVNPNIQPHFTAPNRIQREGSMRRPLMQVQNRQYDSYFQPRGPPPPLSMASSMQYTQQLGHAPAPFHHTPPTSTVRSPRSSQSATQHSLDLEAQTLMRLQSMVDASHADPQIPADKRGPVTVVENSRQLKTNETTDFSSASGQNSLQGITKMQTIQRLAKFDNPVQDFARHRLSEFAVSRIAMNRTDSTASGLSLESILREPLPTVDQSKQIPTGKLNELNRDFQFPPTNYPRPTVQANPLYGAYTQSSHNEAPLVRPRGYPQPLTAGPPGQRQSSGIPGKHNTNFMDSMPTANFNSFGSTATLSPKTTKVTAEALAAHTAAQGQYQGPAPKDSQRRIDTLPLPAIAKYYPDGFCADQTGNYTPLAPDVRREMDRALAMETNFSEEAKSRNKATSMKDKAEDRDNWFYGGQRAYKMSIEEHVVDFEERNERLRANPFGPIGPPSKALKPVVNKPITPAQMEAMSTAQAAAPIMAAAFGTLLSYADNGPASRRLPSRFGPSPGHLIDNSAQGNDSFFGEDWGAPPKRTDGNPRFQSEFLKPNSTFWQH